MPVEVVAALISRAGRLLACQRNESGPVPLKWEFPGGKVEKGEEHLAALGRELKEEIGIELDSATEVFRHTHRYPDGEEVRLRFYRVDAYRGTVINRVFQQILWVDIRRLPEIDFLEGDWPLVEKLTRREIFL